MKAITRRKCLEGFQLIIRSRSGVYRNSWSRLLTEFHFNASEEDQFGFFSPLQGPGNEALCKNYSRSCSVFESGLALRVIKQLSTCAQNGDVLCILSFLIYFAPQKGPKSNETKLDIQEIFSHFQK